MLSLFKLDQLMCAIQPKQEVIIHSNGEKLFVGTTREYFKNTIARDKGKWYVFGIKVTDDKELKVLITERCEI